MTRNLANITAKHFGDKQLEPFFGYDEFLSLPCTTIIPNAQFDKLTTVSFDNKINEHTNKIITPASKSNSSDLVVKKHKQSARKKYLAINKKQPTMNKTLIQREQELDKLIADFHAQVVADQKPRIVWHNIESNRNRINTYSIATK